MADDGASDAPTSSSSAWLAVWTKPRAEKATTALLDARGLEVWLPTVTLRRRWSDRWKNVEFPLFPGYLFAKASTVDWASLLRVPGVLTVVKQGRTPAWIRDEQMTEVRAAADRIVSGVEEPPEIVEDFAPGTRVRVADGPLAGLVGVVNEKRGGRRLLVGFEQIGKAFSVSIGAASVERIDG